MDPALTRAQSMLLATVVRTLIEQGAITEEALRRALDATAQAAFQRRTPETPALLGLIDILRADLGLPEGTRPAGE